MAGQSEAPDDLIAELARLMAGEARPDSAPKEHAQPRIRIPGDNTPQMPPVPRFDFSANPAPAQPAAVPVPPVTPRPAAAQPQQASVPHNFAQAEQRAPQPEPKVQPQAQASAPAQPQPQVAAAPQAPAQPRPAAPQPASAAPAQPARTIPDFDLRPSIAPAQPKPAAREPAIEPFSFDFDLHTNGRNREAAPSPAPAPVAPSAPAAPQPPQPPASVAPNFAPVPRESFAPQPIPVTVSEPAPKDEFEEPGSLDHDSLADLIAAELANDQNHFDDTQRDHFDVEPTVVEAVAPKFEPEPHPEPVRSEVDDIFAQLSSQSFAAVPPDFAPAVETAVDNSFDEPKFTLDPFPPVKPSVASRSEPSFAADPLGDIERLVGPAVRADHDQLREDDEPLAQPEYKPAPPIRSLATPTLPPEELQPTRGPRRRAQTVDAASVDDAILAAAAASGARVEWVDHSAPADEDDYEADLAPRRRRLPISRAVFGPLVALLLLGAGGGALYYMLGNGGPSGPAPVIVADTSPVKDVPEPSNEPAAQSIIFNEMAGGNNGANEQIVPRDQADAATISEATQSSGIGSVINGIDQGTTNPDGLVNRRVRTVTVRPDGTIVSGDSGLAGTSMLPVDRPNVPDLPGNSAPNTALASTTTPAPAAPVAPTPATPTVTPVQPGTIVSVADATGAVLSGRSVTIPSQKPSDFAATAQAALARASSAPAPAAAAPQNLAAPSAPAGGATYVQLSSQRTEQAARESAQAIATRFGVLFGGASLEIQQVNLGDRGIYYRVLVPANTRDGAANICNNVKAAGGDCVLL